MKIIKHNLDCCCNCTKCYIPAYKDTTTCYLIPLDPKDIDDPKNTTCEHIDRIVKTIS